jgi:hypothetical protein
VNGRLALVIDLDGLLLPGGRVGEAQLHATERGEGRGGKRSAPLRLREGKSIRACSPALLSPSGVLPSAPSPS